MRLEQGSIATTFDGRLANLVTAYSGDGQTPEGETIRWLLANLVRTRRGLAAIEADASLPLAVRETARAALEEVPDAG